MANYTDEPSIDGPDPRDPPDALAEAVKRPGIVEACERLRGFVELRGLSDKWAAAADTLLTEFSDVVSALAAAEAELDAQYELIRAQDKELRKCASECDAAEAERKARDEERVLASLDGDTIEALSRESLRLADRLRGPPKPAAGRWRLACFGMLRKVIISEDGGERAPSALARSGARGRGGKGWEMSNRGRYVLDGHEPINEPDLLKWAHWFESADRAVAKTEVGESSVSTVFLGLDYRFGKGHPLLFETLVFGGPFDGEGGRYSTWEEAERGHSDMVATIKRSMS